MAGWRELIGQHLQTDTAVRQANPGVAAFGQLVKNAMMMGVQRKKEVRAEAAAGRTAARTAAYSRYPAAAAEAIGMDVPTTTTTTVPEGSLPYETKVDESGKVTQTYRPPKAVTESQLLELYNDYMVKTQKTNADTATLRAITGKEGEAIPILPFRQWMQQNFPEYTGFLTGESTIEVIRISDGMQGTIPESEWDPSVYRRVGE